jgi:multiple sugar transport system ATP-binding protein
MAQVQLESVGKVYPGGVAAVRDVSLDIADGEFVALVGPSGCGKTTTLRMIAGLEDISAGTIRIGGRVVNGVHPRDRDIAMVFQNYALYPHMTVEKNMSFALRMRRVPKPEIRRRVAEAARILGIEELLGRKPRQLSGGQRQRVAVGRAIVREPKAFLFDEPLSNLDARLRLTTRAELKALHQRLRTTTVYVTHDQEEAMTLGDRIVVMSRGLVQQVGPPLEVYRRPANRFVAGFIGSPPMNFVPGRLAANDGTLMFVEDTPDAAGSPVRVPIRTPRLRRSVPPNAPVVLGFRPQALRPQSQGPELEMVVRVVEPLGDAVDLHGATAAGTPIVARIPPIEPVAPGVSIALRIDPEAIHVFEPGEFGAALLSG